MKAIILMLFLLILPNVYSQRIACNTTQLCKTIEDSTECTNWKEKTTFIVSKNKTSITHIGLVKTIYYIDKIDSANNLYLTHTDLGEEFKITFSENYIYINSISYKGVILRYEVAKERR
jgi:hypothetical protein